MDFPHLSVMFLHSQIGDSIQCGIDGVGQVLYLLLLNRVKEADRADWIGLEAAL
jgi:hypothetical protein